MVNEYCIYILDSGLSVDKYTHDDVSFQIYIVHPNDHHLHESENLFSSLNTTDRRSPCDITGDVHNSDVLELLPTQHYCAHLQSGWRHANIVLLQVDDSHITNRQHFLRFVLLTSFYLSLLTFQCVIFGEYLIHECKNVHWSTVADIEKCHVTSNMFSNLPKWQSSPHKKQLNNSNWSKEHVCVSVTWHLFELDPSAR